jgi:hypothetical protein
VLDLWADSYICLCEMSRLNVYPENPMKIYLAIVMVVLVFAGCSGNKEGEHTTATTVVPPPPRQVLRAETRAGKQVPVRIDTLQGKFDPAKPLLFVYLPGNETFDVNEEVAIVFSLTNVKLRGDGGEYRVRYMVDDDDMQWIDRWEKVVLTGWLPGKHTIRVELIGPDGWPYRNGDYNIVTREITVEK